MYPTLRWRRRMPKIKTSLVANFFIPKLDIYLILALRFPSPKKKRIDEKCALSFQIQKLAGRDIIHQHLLV